MIQRSNGLPGKLRGVIFTDPKLSTDCLISFCLTRRRPDFPSLYSKSLKINSTATIPVQRRLQKKNLKVPSEKKSRLPSTSRLEFNGPPPPPPPPLFEQLLARLCGVVMIFCCLLLHKQILPEPSHRSVGPMSRNKQVQLFMIRRVKIAFLKWRGAHSASSLINRFSGRYYLTCNFVVNLWESPVCAIGDDSLMDSNSKSCWSEHFEVRFITVCGMAGLISQRRKILKGKGPFSNFSSSWMRTNIWIISILFQTLI